MMAELQEACEREAAPRVTVAEREYLLLWKPEDSPEARSFERLLAAAFQPGGIEREAAGRAILAQFMLLSPRLLSIGWHRMRAAATAASSGGDEEEARRAGRAYGAVLRQARDEAEQREAVLKLARDEAARSAIEPATDAPGWVATTQEAISGADCTCSPTWRASTTTRRYGAKGRRCFGRPSWPRLRRARRGRRCGVSPWPSRAPAPGSTRCRGRSGGRRPRGRPTVPRKPSYPRDRRRGPRVRRRRPSGRSCAQRRGGEQRRSSGERNGGRRTIGGGGRRGAKWRPPTPESCRLRGSSRGGQDGRGYPEVLLVEHSPLLMELLYRQDPADALRCSPTAHKMPCSRDSVSCEKRNLSLTSSCAKRNFWNFVARGRGER